MPTTNDFKPFATGGGANVLSQADYLALAALASGFSAGIANPPELNKVWRQACFIAAMVAQTICDETGEDMLDNGDLAAAIVKFKAALAAGSGVISFNTRTGAVTLTSGDVTTALGFTPANKAGETFTGKVNTVASGTGAAGLSIPDGAAPTSPADGDVWGASGKQYRRAGGVTYQTVRDLDAQNDATNYKLDTSSGPNSYNINGMPSATLTTGMRISIQIGAGNTNTGASTVTVNGGSAKAIKKPSAGSLVDVAAGDLVAGRFYELRYDGTLWQVISALN